MRKVIPLSVKIQILDRLKSGEGATSVGRYFNLNEATVRTIKKNEDKIRARMAAGFTLNSDFSLVLQHINIETAEKKLMKWIQTSVHNGITPDSNTIRVEAMKIFNDGNSSVTQRNQFFGSEQWFRTFSTKYSLYDLGIREKNFSA